jgi:integrase
VATSTPVPEIELPRKSAGTRVKSARKTSYQVFSEEELEGIVAGLPDWSKPGREPTLFPIRARFVLARELGLRPATLNKLQVPEHYRRGAVNLTITADVDKTANARQLALSEATRTALDAVLPKGGLIFGKHDYRHALRDAAKAAGIDSERAKRISDYDFRHSAATNLAQHPAADLSGLMHVLGHKNPATTSRYLRPQKAASDRLLAAADSRRREAFRDNSG